MTHETSQVPAIDRALSVLELLADCNKPLAVKDISSSLKIPIASCFRIVKNLQARGYAIESSDSSGQYELGFKVLHLADQKMHKLDLRGVALPYMRDVSTRTHQAVQLGVLDAKGIKYIEQVLPLQPVNIIAPLQVPLAVNISAAGKVMCAYMPLYQQIAYLDQTQFERNTEHSIMDKDEYRLSLRQVQERGFALDIEEYSVGIGCLAVPIFDYRKQCVATIGITGDVEPYRSEQNCAALLVELQRAAAAISVQLGYGS